MSIGLILLIESDVIVTVNPTEVTSLYFKHERQNET